MRLYDSRNCSSGSPGASNTQKSQTPYIHRPVAGSESKGEFPHTHENGRDAVFGLPLLTPARHVRVLHDDPEGPTAFMKSLFDFTPMGGPRRALVLQFK